MSMLSLQDVRPAVVLTGATALALTSLAALSLSAKASGSGGKAPHRSSTTLPLVGDTWDAVALGPSAFVTSKMRDECVRVGGEPVLVRILAQPDMLVVSDPKAVEDVLKSDFYSYERGVYDLFFELTGDSLFGADGESWRVQRRVFAKLFAPSTLRGSADGGDEGVMPVIHRHAATLHRLLSSQQRAEREAERAVAVNLTALMSDFTVDVVTEIGFGVTLGFLGKSADGNAYPTHAEGEDDADDPHAFVRALEDVQGVMGRRFALPTWLWKLQRALSVGRERTLLRDLARVDGVVMRLINRSMAASRDGTNSRPRNLVSVFMDEMRVHADGAEAELKLLRDISVGFLIAGRDSTAQTLSWVLYCIAKHPEVEQKLVAELGQHWPQGRKPTEPFLPTEEQLQQLLYMEAVVRETLRMYPIVAFNVRTCVKDTYLSDGTFVRAGTRMGLPAFAMGRMPQLWGPDADEFQPERWIEGKGDARRVKHVSTFQYPVFHAGPRVCMGRHLAMLEIKTIAATLLSSFRLVLSPKNHEATYVASLTQPMEQPLRVHVIPRADPVAHVA